MNSFAAAIYVICSYLWGVLCIGACTYLVFWRDHSGWWFVLAVLLCAQSTSTNAAKIAGTWRPEMEEDK